MNFWKGEAEDVPTAELEIPSSLWREYCGEYDDRCPSERPETLNGLMECAPESDTCENALESIFWRCYHSDSPEAATEWLGEWNEEPSNVCYGAQKAFHGAGLRS